MSKNDESPLLAAARALASDLERFEKLSFELTRITIHSDKTLERARRGLLECSEHESKLAESLRAFALAMQGIQDTQQRCLQQTASAAERIRQRQEQRARLQDRLQLLSQKASEVTSPVGDSPDSPNPTSSELVGSLQEIARRLDPVIAEAAEISKLAHEGEWLDIARDTGGLEQQLLATKNRVLLSLRRLAESAPS